MIFNHQSQSKVGKTITFYSYKGGVGRSMALVNIACLMAQQGKKVLIIDWDLEAPGLHSFFNKNKKKDKPGLVDFITHFIEEVKPNLETDEPAFIDFLNQNLEDYIQKEVRIEKSQYRLDLMQAGKFDKNYTAKLNAIDWIELYRSAPGFFRTFAKQLEAEYDFILIDSRTGLSDTGGICTMLMPQILVLVFALNHQNLNGVLDVAEQSIEYRLGSNDERDLKILPLPSRIDNQNASELQEWINHYTRSFKNLYKKIYLLDECRLENYFNLAKIPYKPEHAYGEKIPVLSENTNNDFFISYHYAQFFKLILEKKEIYEILSDVELKFNLKKANNHVQEAINYFHEGKFELAIKECEISLKLNENNLDALNTWGLSLTEQAKSQKGATIDLFYNEAIKKYQRAIEIEPALSEAAYNNIGAALTELAKSKSRKTSELLLKDAIKNYQKSIEIYPSYSKAYGNWGTVLSELAYINTGKKAEKYYLEAIDKYEQAIKEDSKNHNAYSNWGTVLSNLALMQTGDAAEALHKEAIKKFEKAIEIKPDLHKAYYNMAHELIIISRTKSKTESETLLKQALEIAKKAVELKGDSYNLACINALLKNIDDALYYLDLSLKAKEVTVDYVTKDEDWQQWVDNKDFQKVIEKYK